MKLVLQCPLFSVTLSLASYRFDIMPSLNLFEHKKGFRDSFANKLVYSTSDANYIHAFNFGLANCFNS